jgi:hypothetical protein
MLKIVWPELFIIASVIGIVAFGIWSAIRRLQKKLSSDAKPTAWTYLNEFGGYIVVGAVLLLSMLIVVLSQLFG